MYRIKSKLAISMLASIFIVLMLVFLISEQIAYVSFANVLFDRYAESAYRTAMTGVSYIDASKLEEYIETEGSGEDYKMILEDMQTLCDTQNVTIIYVIIPSSDYKSITNVLSTINSNYSYECWPVGYHKLTTNVDYENAYRQLFEKKVDSVTVIRNKGFLVTGSHITELVPVEYDGKVTGILCVEKPMDELDKIKRFFASVTGKAMLAFILVLTFSYGIFLHKRILKPLSIITEEAERFARETSAPEKPLCSLIKNTDEIGVLARSIDKMTADTLENLKRITNDAVERESTKTQLDVARRIQYGIVPAQTHIPGGRFEVFALSDPARSVGGDFYDCFRVDNGKICVAVGDVSGKGIGAALFMVTTKTMLREHLREGFDPASALNTVNDSLCALNPEELFVTAFVAVLEIKTGRLVYANAGHTRPLIISENAVFRDVEPGIALGLFEDSAI
ncbi:MAG: SpoIIE family protein phosphatase, partial [Firmicutes bacterium]|nr:SpoIIE family protein phosphatase [Bacillota bacterium]